MFGVVDRLNVKVNKDVVKDLIAKNLDSYKALRSWRNGIPGKKKRPKGGVG